MNHQELFKYINDSIELMIQNVLGATLSISDSNDTVFKQNFSAWLCYPRSPCPAKKFFI
ncbi:MAG: hypothetical protein RR716_04985 [Christensenellaceae bacterium]